MEYLDQVEEVQLITKNDTRQYIKWVNTELGRDRTEVYERINNGIAYVNAQNRNMIVSSGNLFFDVLEKIYRRALKNINISKELDPISELKELIKDLPPIRWNIIEKDENGDYPYYGDEVDNVQHMSEEDAREYFVKIVSTLKKIKEKIESL